MRLLLLMTALVAHLAAGACWGKDSQGAPSVPCSLWECHLSMCCCRAFVVSCRTTREGSSVLDQGEASMQEVDDCTLYYLV